MTRRDKSEQKSSSCDSISESEIDESLAETFPASDPPPWTLGVEPHCHQESTTNSNQPANEITKVAKKNNSTVVGRR